MKDVARRMLRLYPRRWRARYESEVIALIEDTGATSRTTVDLLWGAGREWARAAAGQSLPTSALLEVKELPAAYPPARYLKFQAIGCCLALGALAMALVLRPHVAVPRDPVMVVAYAVWFAALARSTAVGLSFRRPDRQLRWAMSMREIAFWTPILIASFILTDLERLEPSTWHYKPLLPFWVNGTFFGGSVFACFEFATKRAVAFRQHVRREREKAMKHPPTGFTSGL